MNTKLPLNDVKEILQRKKTQAEYKLVKCTTDSTKVKYRSLIEFYESNLYYLNRILNRHGNG
jgi:hypothetical protein